MKFIFCVSILQSFTRLVPFFLESLHDCKVSRWHRKGVDVYYMYQKHIKVELMLLPTYSLDAALYASQWKPYVVGILQHHGL